ncbi:MAG TPA: hypothetical protein DEQ98_12570, partial [Acidobacteria bacterium]|nr:hypothetical protein [Acidobacteriota bacterium]
MPPRSPPPADSARTGNTGRWTAATAARACHQNRCSRPGCRRLPPPRLWSTRSSRPRRCAPSWPPVG